jgi:hypothetical protein
VFFCDRELRSFFSLPPLLSKGRCVTGGGDGEICFRGEEDKQGLALEARRG